MRPLFLRFKARSSSAEKIDVPELRGPDRFSQFEMNIQETKHFREGARTRAAGGEVLRVVAGVDWSDDSLAGIRQVSSLYAPHELVLVHAVQFPGIRSPVGWGGRDAQESIEPHIRASVAAASRSLRWTSLLTQRETCAVRQVCEVGAPARLLLNTARLVEAKLIVVGRQGADDLAASHLTMGSVSHGVSLHAPCSTLIVKESPRITRRILVVMQHGEAMHALQRWLMDVLFKGPLDLTVLGIVPRSQQDEPNGPLSVRFWKEATINNARCLSHHLAQSLERPMIRTTSRTRRGDPATIIAEESADVDLIVVYASDRKDIRSGLSGSLWRVLLRLSRCSILIVRPSWA